MSITTIETATPIPLEGTPATVPADDDLPYLFSNEQFCQMVEADVFPREARVYLWEGRVLQKMAKKQAHNTAGAKFLNGLFRLTPNGWFVNFEASVTAGPGKVPLPDLMILRGTPDDYPDFYPTAADVGLVIELSYTSLKRDLGTKMAGYARSSFPTYWVADLIHGTIIEHCGPLPDEGRYAAVRTYVRGESITLTLDDAQLGPIAVDDLMPRR